MFPWGTSAIPMGWRGLRTSSSICFSMLARNIQ
uniref:Uncharacterized protein n=1 Tax=Arundo donax TaxID=35708 RepID=A0A0A9HB48_ARUDO